jgi:hypothetical protein
VLASELSQFQPIRNMMLQQQYAVQLVQRLQENESNMEHRRFQKFL